jgi:hypothetical protein
MIILRRHILCGLLFFGTIHVLEAAKNVTKTNLYSLGSILKKNEKKPFIILKAMYGVSAKEKSVDVTSFLSKKAAKGVLYIPQDMESTFKVDPAPGQDKALHLIFATGDEKTYEMTIDDEWQIPAWYNFMQDEKNQVMVIRDPYLQAKKCSLDDLMVLLKVNNKKPFKIINGQYGKLNTQKIVDITRNLDLYARTGTFMLPESGLDFCQKDPAPDADKKIQVVFEIADQWYQVQVSDQWTMPGVRAVNDIVIDDTIEAARNLLVTRAVTHNITFLKPFQLNHINCLKNILIANNNAPFIIVNAFITQPYFVNIEYDMTAAIQAHADMGILCLPQDLRTYIGNQGTLPYMYVAKILFLMNGITYNLCYRNAFFSVPVPDYQVEFDAMIEAINPYIHLP